MKKYLLYVIGMLFPMLALAQDEPPPPPYILIGENTTCGGNIKVDWSNAITYDDLSKWRVELYNSSGVKLSQQNFDTDGKAQFSDLSSGTYKVKITLKSFPYTHPDELTQIITSTYRRFAVISKGQSAAEKATGECANNGKATIKIKDGEGPFVVKIYEGSQLVVTSPATNKGGSETSIQVQGLKPSTRYQVEVTDQVGGGSCSITEPKEAHQFTTLDVSTPFLRNAIMETCRPLKAGETMGARGLITIEINNSAALGPFTVKVIKDGGEVVVANASITKSGATGTTTKNIEPDAGKSFDANTYYTVQVTDGSCVAERRLYKEYRYSPAQFLLHLAPSCAANCQNYDLAFTVYYNTSAENYFYPYRAKLKVTRGGTEIINQDFNANDALPVTRTDSQRVVYGNEEFAYWIWHRHRVHKPNVQVKAGDIVTLEYNDCAGVTRSLTHTVLPGPMNPDVNVNDILPDESTPNACDKVQRITTRFQHWSGNTYYTAFCNLNGLKYRVKRSGVVTPVINDTPPTLFKYYDQVDNNSHRFKVQTGSNYEIEYAEASALLDGSNTANCKHYKGTYTANSNINPLDRINIVVGGSVPSVLEFPSKGNKLFIGGDNPLTAGLDFITDNNKLTMRIVRRDGQPNEQEIDVQGPWNLRGKYKVKFPITKMLYPSMNGNNYLYQFFDFPTGQYTIY